MTSIQQFVAPPTIGRFIMDDNPVVAIMGPVGSGKSSGAFMKLLRHGREQRKGPNGRRRTRWAVSRSCYDDQTEILTEKRGWVLFKNLTGADKVATLKDERMTFERPTLLAKSAYKGDMIGLASQNMDLLVTPDHRLWVSHRRGRAKVWNPYRIVPADSIEGIGGVYRCAATSLPAVGAKSSHSTDMFEFFGFVLADGWAGVKARTDTIGNHYSVVLTQKKFKPYVERLLKRCGFNYGIHQRNNGACNYRLSVKRAEMKRLASMLAECGTGRRKHVPRWMIEAPEAHLRAFLHGYAMGDGHLGTKTGNKSSQLYTVSKLLADQLHEMIVRIGHSACLNYDRANDSYFLTLMTPKRQSPVLNMGIWRREKYDGVVYCVEVSTHVVYVRRNGKAVWCSQTYRALSDTTVKTIFDWLPPNAGDRMWTPSDMRYNFAIGDADFEILFRSLDTPDDIKKLLSLELTGFWVNEAREIDLSIVHVLRGRCGRYPSAREEGCTWHGGFMDTNPPDDDHWWFKIFEEERPEGWSLHKQPAGDGPDAENIENLVNGYYDNLKSGADGEFVKVYIRGEYGFVRSGQPVYPHYKDSTHCAAAPFGPMKGIVIEVGVDSSGLTPAAVFGQKLPNGRTVRFDEMIGDGMGAQRFLEAVRERLAIEYPTFEAKLWGDPSGMKRSDTDEKTWYGIAQDLGLSMQPARTNLIVPRIESVSALHRMMADGMPAYMISPKCRILRKGLNGGYSYRRVQIGGEQRFMSTPDKNRFSHPCDADQYLTIEMTGGVSIVTGEDEPKKKRDRYRARDRGAEQSWMAG